MLLGFHVATARVLRFEIILGSGRLYEGSPKPKKEEVKSKCQIPIEPE
jgi:hypothetical protein